MEGGGEGDSLLLATGLGYDQHVVKEKQVSVVRLKTLQYTHTHTHTNPSIKLLVLQAYKNSVKFMHISCAWCIIYMYYVSMAAGVCCSQI